MVSIVFHCSNNILDKKNIIYVNGSINPLATDRVISGRYGAMLIIYFWTDLVFS